ncbi:MAG: lipase family protein [Caldilineaceae bacterium]
MKSQSNTYMSRRKFLHIVSSLAASTTLGACIQEVSPTLNSRATLMPRKESVSALPRAAPEKPVDGFTAILDEPPDYRNALPNFCNAYICVSMAKLARKETVRAVHTDDAYKKAVRETLTNWGLDGADETIFFNSREIQGKRPGTQGIIAFHNQTAFVVFRSTEKKFNDWMTDFNVRQVTSPCGKGKIHAGFLDAFNAVVPDKGEPLSDFEKVINQLRSMKAVWLIGHSLGGALAAVATSCILQTDINVAGLYTFGAPRVGDSVYRDYMNRSLTYKYWRFMHKHDLVPDVPLPNLIPYLPFRLVTGYSREGNMLRLNEEGYEVLRLVGPDGKKIYSKTYNGTSVPDHAIEHYRSRLLNLVRLEIPEFPELNYLNIPSEIELDTTSEDIESIENSVDGTQ